MKYSLLAVLTCALLFSACRKAEEPLPPLTGTWRQVDLQPNFAAGVNTITFSDGGAFSLSRALWSDAYEPSNPCSGNRMQYMHGSYIVSNRELTLNGHYCDSAFAKDIADCALGTTVFSEQYSLSSSDGKLILNSSKGYSPVILKPL